MAVKITLQKNLKFLFVLLLILNCNDLLYGQNDEDFQIKNKAYIFLDVITPSLYQDRPRWNFGYAQRVKEKWKVGLNLGYGNENLSFYEVPDDYSLWEIRPQLYYIINPNHKTLKYFSLEAFYINQTQEMRDKVLRDPDIINGYFSYDSADYSRNKYGATLNFGFLVNISKHIGFNFFAGLGARIRDNQFSNIENLEEMEHFEEHLSPYYRTKGKNTSAEVNLGLKLFYRLN